MCQHSKHIEYHINRFIKIDQALKENAGDAAAENEIIEKLYGDITTPVLTEEQIDLMEAGFPVEPNKYVPEMDAETFKSINRRLQKQGY